MICFLQQFDSNSRLIQLVHIFQSTLSNEASHRVASEIICEFNLPYDPTDLHSLCQWIDENHPYAYPFVTGVIGFYGPWLTTVDEVELVLSQLPYLYQGRIEFAGL
jgi:hypothetical protein